MTAGWNRSATGLDTQGGWMASEYLLKLIVNGLQNLAADNEIVCEYLNRRAVLYGYLERFEGAPFAAPAPPYADKLQSQLRAADLIGRIADDAALALRYLGGEPASPDVFDGQASEDDLLRLVLDWATLQSGLYKVILRLYGRQPLPSPALASPGPSSDKRLWAEIVAWFEKIAADTERVTGVQHLPSGPLGRKRSRRSRRPSGRGGDLILRRLEQGVRRATLNTLGLAGRLPHHLYHAARADRTKAARR
jgi:hypothetical protein